ncbi:MAG: DUF2905 domain-containing protein [Anaerolineae bacterium]
MAEMGRLLLILGVALALVGLVILAGGRFFPWLGHLPGDIRIERENFKLYFPLTTMILLSVIGSLVLNIIIRIFRR